MLLLGIAAACKPSVSSDTNLPDEDVQPEAEEEGCTNTFPADVMPVQRITEYGTELLSREDIIPKHLSETGLYIDILTKEIHPAFQEFTPRFQLWSDGAEKRRWVYIPECDQIDASDIDDWSFPVGTRFFKEFAIDGKLIETRFIERIGEGPRDFAYASYLWNEDESEAEIVGELGLLSVKNTEHDIPSKQDCLRCHGSYALGGGRASRALGFSAIQLNHTDTALSLEELIDQDRFVLAPDIEAAQIAGDEPTQEALGYLHANCGNCHHQDTDRLPQFNLNLWLDAGITSPALYGAWQSAIDNPAQIFQDQHVDARIVSGNPERSALIYRMQNRGNTAQMPPIGTKIVDEAGLQLLSDWISSLP